MIQDLAAFKIKELKPQLSIDEVSSGIGGICGSVTLNMRFREFLQKKLNTEIPPEALDEVSFLPVFVERMMADGKLDDDRIQ